MTTFGKFGRRAGGSLLVGGQKDPAGYRWYTEQRPDGSRWRSAVGDQGGFGFQVAPARAEEVMPSVESAMSAETLGAVRGAAGQVERAVELSGGRGYAFGERPMGPFVPEGGRPIADSGLRMAAPAAPAAGGVAGAMGGGWE